MDFSTSSSTSSSRPPPPKPTSTMTSTTTIGKSPDDPNVSAETAVGNNPQDGPKVSTDSDGDVNLDSLATLQLGELTTVFSTDIPCGMQYLSATIGPAPFGKTFEGSPTWYGRVGETCHIRAVVSTYKEPNYNCFPRAAMLSSAYESGISAGDSRPFVALYSPGLVCPSGYEPARTLVITDGPGPPTKPTDINYSFDKQIWKSLSTSESLVECCPTGFAPHSRFDSCISWLAAGATASAFVWDRTCSPSPTNPSIPPSAAETGMLARRIHLVVPEGAQYGDPSFQALDKNNDKTWSKPAKTAVGVVSAIAALSLIAVAFLLIRSYRRRRLDPDGNKRLQEPEFGEQKSDETHDTAELNTTQRNELSGSTSHPVELDGSDAPRLARRGWDRDANYLQLQQTHRRRRASTSMVERSASTMSSHLPPYAEALQAARIDWNFVEERKYGDSAEDIEAELNRLRNRQFELENRLAHKKKAE